MGFESTARALDNEAATMKDLIPRSCIEAQTDKEITAVKA
jgi:hypothetical protein